jgi:hypothetical protein
VAKSLPGDEISSWRRNPPAALEMTAATQAGMIAGQATTNSQYEKREQVFNGKKTLSGISIAACPARVNPDYS